MKISCQCFFRLGIILVLGFITLSNIRGFPSEAEAVVVRLGTFGHVRSGGSYHNSYGGRVIWQSFGRGGSRRSKYEEPVDKNRAYYEKKMAEWREKNKDKLEEMEANREEDEQNESDSPEGSYEYEYDEEPSTTTTTEIPETSAILATVEPTTSELVLNGTSKLPGNSTESTMELTSLPLEVESNVTTTEPSTTTPKTTTRTRRNYGLRYGRVKIETIQ